MPDAKEVTVLIGHIRATGEYKAAKSGNQKHWKVMKKNGAAVVDENGPLIISSSPSETRFIEMTVSRLMKAGVLKTDPYKKTPSGPAALRAEPPVQKKRGAHLTDPKVREAMRAGQVARSARLKEQTAVLRGRVEPIVAKLGGWRVHGGRSGISATDFASTAMHWARQRGRVELPKDASVTNVANGVRNLAQPGETMGEKWHDLFVIFIDELERESGVPPDPAESALRYQELYRDALGISAGPRTPLPPAEAAPVVRAEVGPRYSDRPTSLAFRVMYWLGKTDIEQAEASEIVAQIAEMEITR